MKRLPNENQQTEITPLARRVIDLRKDRPDIFPERTKTLKQYIIRAWISVKDFFLAVIGLFRTGKEFDTTEVACLKLIIEEAIAVKEEKLRRLKEHHAEENETGSSSQSMPAHDVLVASRSNGAVEMENYFAINALKATAKTRIDAQCLEMMESSVEFDQRKEATQKEMGIRMPKAHNTIKNVFLALFVIAHVLLVSLWIYFVFYHLLMSKVDKIDFDAIEKKNKHYSETIMRYKSLYTKGEGHKEAEDYYNAYYVNPGKGGLPNP
ncbi:uncharacterized protein NEMAJ01_1945 [Nematocida major]|uniref:uncharacterized protein n=1 Tax=Nematocida major TaxID=1912982 RepID=UPI002007D2E8|nr:uncharacterized protein NEMAJ01_1945 [Nematocida major]KAH9387049.1 hypothetical protein NEMAJ01_1945 [Nematocida major]